MFLYITSFAQDQDSIIINSGELYKTIHSSVNKVVSINKQDVFSIKMDGDKFILLQKFDFEKLNLVEQQKYDDLPKSSNFVDIIHSKNNLYVVYSVYYNEGNSKKFFKLFYREIDFESGQLLDPIELLKTSKKVVNSSKPDDLSKINSDDPIPELFLGGPKFLKCSSFNKNVNLFYYQLEQDQKIDSKNKEVFGFFLFNQKMEKIWSKEVIMPLTEDKMNIKAIAVGEDKKVRVFYINKENKEYESIIISESSLITVSTGVKATKPVFDINMVESRDSNFLCFGIYALKFIYKAYHPFKVRYVADGLNCFEIDPNGSLIRFSEFEFPGELVRQNLLKYQKRALMKRERKGKEFGIFDLVLKGVVTKPDGSQIIYAERQEKQEVRNRTQSSGTVGMHGSYGSQKYYIYHYMDIVVTKVSAAGKLEWMKKIPKWQRTKRDNLFKEKKNLSFSYHGDSLFDYLLYVDNPKNNSLGPEAGPAKTHINGYGGWITLCRIDLSSGDTEKYSVIDLVNLPENSTTDFFDASLCTMTSSNSFVLEQTTKYMNDLMIKIVFSE